MEHAPSPETRAGQLRLLLEEHNRRYYTEAAPTVTDQEYDALLRELVDLETQHPELRTPDSPTQHVGGKPLDEFAHVEHRTPMLSLDNTYSEEEVGEWFRRLEKHLPAEEIELIVEPKVDGVAISLLYEDGRLQYAATRGDGRVGDDVTQNVLTIRGIPRDVKGGPALLEVRGEVYMTRDGFRKMNEERAAAGLPEFANPRNSAAGSLKQLDAALVRKRPLGLILHGMGAVAGGEPLNTYLEGLELLDRLGLPRSKTQTARTLEEVLAAIRHIDETRHGLPFETDGAVVKVNSFTQRERAGFTSKAPRWAIAYKYRPEQAETRLRGITIQVGRTGVLTPVAELDPVFVSGTTVARATLHNEEEIARKDIRIGDLVIVEKAGEIIPAVIGVKKEARTGGEQVFKMPDQCPICGSDVVRDPEQVAVRCINAACPAQVRRKLQHFASRGAMDIEGLGEAMVEQLVEHRLAQDVSEIYKLTAERLAEIPRTGTKSIENLLAGIEESRTRPLWRLIFGLGILHVGVTGARNLAQHFHTIEPMMNAELDELQRIPDVGEIMGQSIFSFFRDEHNRALLERLKAAGLNMGERDPRHVPASNAPLGGTTWVITGTLSEEREAIAETIRKHGGKVSASISKKTTYLLAGEEAGSKLKKAESLGVKIVSEGEFREMIGATLPAG
jgi:DNA ligase (NAD+)